MNSGTCKGDHGSVYVCGRDEGGREGMLVGYEPAANDTRPLAVLMQRVRRSGCQGDSCVDSSLCSLSL